MRRKQHTFDKDGLLSALQSEIEGMNAQNLSQLAGMVFGMKFYPRGSFNGQLFVTEDKVTNSHLEKHLGHQADLDQEVLGIIKEIKEETKGNKLFPKVALRLISHGYHLSFSDIKEALEYVQ